MRATDNPAGERACVTALSGLSRRALCGLGAFGLFAAGAYLTACAAQGSDGAAESEAEQTPADEAEQGTEGAETPAAASADPVKKSTFAFNTLVSITAYGVGEEVVDECLADCATYENLFSARREGTDIARVNASASEPVEVDPDTAELLGVALEYGATTGGAFDVTIGSVSLLWDFVEGVKPDDADIEEGLRHVDYTQVHVDGTTVTLGDPDAKIDLGGIAKGWIAGRLADKLRAAGATAALVDLGTSSVVAVGAKADGSAWRIGLRDPLDSYSQLSGIVELSDETITSSGLYDQEFELDGQTYWHILDPATGYPAQTDVLGVTLIGADPVQGDALSTTLFTMGIEQGSAWIEENYPDIAVMFVDDAGASTFVNGFEDHGYTAVAAQ